MWNLPNAKQCLNAYGGHPKRILIIGCGDKGEDAKAFNELLNGEVEITGVDIIDDIGVDYQAENVLYIQDDAMALSIRSSNFDLAYSFATFEHINNLQAAWQNMLNALRPGGMLWCVASPLWMSPYGPHKQDIFEAYPYIHLRYPDPEALKQYCQSIGLAAHDGIDIVHHIDYMMNGDMFNKHGPSAYEDAVSKLTNCKIIKNAFDELPRETIVGSEDLLQKGFSEKDLLSLTHRLHAIKE